METSQHYNNTADFADGTLPLETPNNNAQTLPQNSVRLRLTVIPPLPSTIRLRRRFK